METDQRISELRTLLLETSKNNEDFPSIDYVDDIILKRFLNARKQDVKQALDQLVKTLIWRRTIGADTILNEPDKQETFWQKMAPHILQGQDKEGRPLYWERTGLVRIPEMLNVVNLEEILLRHVRHNELVAKKLKIQSKLLGKEITQQVVIMDMTGLSVGLDTKGTKLFTETVNIDQNYYPETLALFFIINVPWIFKPLWVMIKPWLDPVTASKFHILGGDYKKVLQQFIDLDQIPTEFGGNAEFLVPKGNEEFLETKRDDDFLLEKEENL